MVGLCESYSTIVSKTGIKTVQSDVLEFHIGS